MKTISSRIILILFSALFFITTCKKETAVTDFQITDVSVSGNSVNINGKINSLSNNNLSDYGVCYSTSNNPVATDTAVRLGVPKVGTFSAQITNLQRNKTYYFRAFIKEAGSYLYDDMRSAKIDPILPGVTTLAATGMTASAATLNATVNPNGSPAAVTFEYGLTNTYGSTATASPASVNGNAASSVSAAISSLSPGTLYHFRVKAVNTAGTITGEDLTFTTTSVQPTATTLAASAITQTSATLNGTVNPNGSSTTVTFEYGTTFLYGSSVAATPGSVNGVVPTSVSASLTSLTPGTLYHFRVKTVSAAGTINGEDITFTTPQPPLATTQAATNITQTTATLNGTVNAYGLSTTITFQYGTTASYGTTVNGAPASTSASQNTASAAAITGLTPNTTYHYSITGVSSAGTGNGTDMTFTTSAVTPVAPTVSTDPITSITTTTATGGGNVTSDGGSPITARGVCWSTTHNPNIAESKTSDGATAGAFSSSLASLTPGTVYYVRAYAINSVGTAYGNEVSFTTQAVAAVAPTVITITATVITTTSASSGGNVTADGGATVTERGICWGTSPNPTTAGSKASNGLGTGFYPANLTGLSAGTMYYVRAYAINNAGTGYGNQVSFTTLANDPVVPTITTSAVSNITSSSATGGGNVTSDGGSNVNYRGICYSTSPSPTINDSKTIDGSGTGSFSGVFTGLLPNTLYYVRAYATNIAGTAYGNEVSFTSAPPDAVPPTVTTAAISAITYSSASGGGNVTSDGGGTVTARGICWSTVENPTTADQKTSDGTGSGAFTSSMASLSASTIYYVRAYATNSAGTSYGAELSFTTDDPPASLPTLTTLAASTITSSTASSGGNITNDGGAPVTARGVCWGTSANPTTNDSKTTDGTGSGFFTSSLAGLNYNTTYHIRAYAINSAGTAYGDDKTFTTPYPDPVLPTVTTTTPSAITHNSATGGGNVTFDGYTTVTDRGICWSTVANPTIANSKLSIGSGTGSYSGSMTGLTASTLYHVRAYATNSAGTSYGNDLTFTSSAPPYTLATLSTTAASSVTHNAASSGGNVTSDGGATITARGVCYGTSSGPTISGTKTSDGTGSGAFASSLAGLVASTTYYYRAYATNAAGTAYGNELTLTTNAPPPDLPSVTTTAISGIGTTTASSGGNVTYGGTSAVTARGICWSGALNPTIADSKTTDGTGTGTFVSSMSGLIPCSTYHVRAYATNSTGTAYGADVLFTTGTVVSAVTTTSVSAITSSTASSGGTVSGDCTAGVTARGVCWGTSPAPTIAGSKTIDGTGSGAYSSSITGLSPCTLYYVRSYVTNSAGTAYGNEVTFTSSPVVSTVTTTAISAITSTTASSGGTVSGSCTSGITARGVCWSTSSGPTAALATKTIDGTATGAYSSSITGLTPCTLYYVRAYVTNAAGTSYGAEVTFTSGTALPTVSTSAITSITSVSAVSGGILSGNCLSAITAKGVCWSTSPGPTTANSKTNNGSGSSNFSSSITGLTRVTTYYVRAYATNAAGTAYGNEVSFTTSAALPTVSTTSPSIISAALSWAGGNMTDNGGATVTDMGVCYNTTGSPTTADPVSSYGSGAGAYTVSVSNLTAGAIYYMRAYATNSAGTNYGNQVSFTVPATVSDYQGNSYKTVSISGQVWMQENLRATVYNDGSGLIQYTDTMSFGYDYYHSYNNNVAYDAAYAYMYNGNVVGGAKNICPVGWHVPTTTDWGTLATNLGGYSVAGAKINDLATTFVLKLGLVWSYWNSAMSGHDNSSAFYGRGGGYYLNSYAGLKNTTMWWVSNKQYVRIDYNSGILQGIGSVLSGTNDNAFYIRCKKN